MSSSILRLGTRDATLVDGDVIRVMRHTLGDADCEDLVEDCAFHLVEALSRLELVMGTERLAEIDRLGACIAAQSGRIGMRHMQSVAYDLSICAQRADPTAMRAVAARLIRMGEDALFSLTRYIE